MAGIFGRIASLLYRVRRTRARVAQVVERGPNESTGPGSSPSMSVLLSVLALFVVCVLFSLFFVVFFFVVFFTATHASES